MKIKLLMTGVLLGLLAVSACTVLDKLDRQPAVPDNYSQQIDGLMPIEANYTKMGQFAVASHTLPSGQARYGECKIWYPKSIEAMTKLPVVVFANGTSIPYYKYEAVFLHLASFGFVVIGNDDKESFRGDSSSHALAVLDKLNLDKTSIFYNKLDTHTTQALADIRKAVWGQSMGRQNLPTLTNLKPSIPPAPQSWHWQTP